MRRCCSASRCAARDLQADAQNDQLQLSYWRSTRQGKMQRRQHRRASRCQPQAGDRSAHRAERHRMLQPDGSAAGPLSAARRRARFGRRQCRFGARTTSKCPDFAKSPIGISGAGADVADGRLRCVRRCAPTSSCAAVLPASPVARPRVPAERRGGAVRRGLRQRRRHTPHKVDITTTITTDEGRVMFKTDEERDSSRPRRQVAAATASARRFRCKDIAPGSYVLTVSAEVRLGPPPRSGQSGWSAPPPSPAVDEHA